jgi:hypothetical protein
MRSEIPNFELAQDHAEVCELKDVAIDESEYPVLKISPSGKILYANSASFEYLREWLTGSNDSLPENFLEKNSELLDPQAEFSFSLETKSGVFCFDVVGFQECGYIGLYGFQRLN